jgi:hypothetical protein
MATVNDDYPKNRTMTDDEMKAAAIAQFEAKQTTIGEKVHDFPTEIMSLPSKGKLYPKGHILSSGKIEMKYMTAKEEDILTNQSFIQNGVVLDKLFQSLIVTPIDYNDLLLCDKNAIMIAARILGYGKDYPIRVKKPNTNTIVDHVVDLTQLQDKEIDWSLITEGVNSFEFELPVSKKIVTLKLLTQGVQRKLDAELKSLEKINKNASLTTLLKYIIIAIDGETDNGKIRKFVDKELLAIDSRAIRTYLKQITPEILMEVDVPDGDSGDTFRCSFDAGLDLFWPDAGV